MSMGQLAERVGVSSNHMSEVSRGGKNMSPRVQIRVEAALDAPVKVEPAEQGDVDPRALWDRMDAHERQPRTRWPGWPASAPVYLSQIMNGQRKPVG